MEARWDLASVRSIKICLKALAKELRNRQRRLLDSMKDLKGSPNREDLEAVMKELRKLEELLRSVMDTLRYFASLFFIHF